MKLNFNLIKDYFKKVLTSSDNNTYSCNYINTELNKKQPLVDYSQNEVNTGRKWIDGKTIYSKVIIYDSNTALSSGGVSLNHNVSNIGSYKCIVKYGFVYNNTAYAGYANDTSFAFLTGFTSTRLDGYIGGSWGGLFKYVYAVIEYTKSN